MKKILLALCTVFLTLSAANADIKKEITDQFNTRINNALKVVVNNHVGVEERNKQIVKAISPMFDFELMAKLSLGGKVWTSLDKHQQQLFVDLYVARMKKSYSEKIDAYTNETIVINEVTLPKSNRAVINTNLVSNTDKISIDYKMYQPNKQIDNKDKWLIYDVDISGVSILKTDRAQFAEVLKTNSIDYLMDQMNEKR